MAWNLLVPAVLAAASGDLAYYPPQPEPKPCARYWNSEEQRQIAAHHPDVTAYLASKTEVIARMKEGYGIMVFASPRGCAVARLLEPIDVARLFSGKQGDA